MGGCCCCSSRGAEPNSIPAYYHYAHKVNVLLVISPTLQLVANKKQELERAYDVLYLGVQFLSMITASWIIKRKLLCLPTIFDFLQFPRSSEEQVPLSTRHVGASGLSAGFLVNTDLEASIPNTYQPPPAPIPYEVDSGTPTPSGARETLSTNNDAAAKLTHSDSGANVADSPGSLEKDSKETDGKNTDLEQTTPIDLETELNKSGESTLSMVEECPTCLEEYNEENPKILTRCGHHFHLACILEWMERSDKCPVCDKTMKIEEMFNG